MTMYETSAHHITSAILVTLGFRATGAPVGGYLRGIIAVERLHVAVVTRGNDSDASSPSRNATAQGMSISFGVYWRICSKLSTMGQSHAGSARMVS